MSSDADDQMKPEDWAAHHIDPEEDKRRQTEPAAPEPETEPPGSKS